LQIDAGVERLGMDAKEIGRGPAQLVRPVAPFVEEPAGIVEDCCQRCCVMPAGG
jgi:hypothetical protein